jgi:S1-C subfamily serine protease
MAQNCLPGDPTMTPLRRTALTALALTLLPALARANETVYQKALRSTVLVIGKGPNNRGFGTGAVIDLEQRLVVTNYHVVGETAECVLFFPAYRDGRAIPEKTHYLDHVNELALAGRVVAKDPKCDLAIVQVERLPEGVAAMPLAASSPRPGQQVHSIGCPKVSDALWVYSGGSVRQVYHKRIRVNETQVVDAQVVETQAPVNPGDNGGPVVNDKGELIAVVLGFQKEAQLVSPCIDVTELKSLLSRMNQTASAVPQPKGEAGDRD